MAEKELFSELSVQHSAKVLDAGRARLREPVRDQIELRSVDLDALLSA
ncbi:hypothetical protein HNR60_000372, partial [Rhodopseudomonas rhenobacensis]|nr:hypothetical protein [Rhodopseudomonas rhenobacensis]